jgi:hypothetical protein
LASSPRLCASEMNALARAAMAMIVSAGPTVLFDV